MKIEFTFHRFDRDYENYALKFGSTYDVTVKCDKSYCGFTNDPLGNKIMHLEFEPTDDEVMTECGVLFAGQCIPNQLVSVYIDGNKFNGVIKRAKISKKIQVFDEPDFDDSRYKITSLHVTLLITQIVDDDWFKVVG